MTRPPADESAGPRRYSLLERLRRASLYLAACSLLALAVGLVGDAPRVWEPAAVVSSAALSIGLGAVGKLRGYQFTAWIVASVTAAMIYPEHFLHVGAIDLRNPWVILVVVQLVMFGMGTRMSLVDFGGVLKQPRAVLVGVGLQFSVMPLTGYLLARTFRFPPEIAAGVVLIGSCSSGLASNVMSYIAGARLALSVTLTAVATVLAPLATPLWMKLLAGEFVEVEFFKMMAQIIKIVVVPVGAALLHDYLKRASARGRQATAFAAAGGIVWLLFISLGGWSFLSMRSNAAASGVLELGGFVLGAVVAAVAYHQATLRCPRLDRCMPIVSMSGIVYFTAVTTAAGRDHLLVVGGALFLVAIAHNTAGYALGYWLSRLCGLDERSARTVGFEVGMQNGGMASGLAGAMNKLGTVGLASAIFSPWMNVSGSVLANYWRRRPARSTACVTESPPEVT